MILEALEHWNREVGDDAKGLIYFAEIVGQLHLRTLNRL